MAQQMCWKPSEACATSDDYYDKLLMTVMMEAAAAAPRPSDNGLDHRARTENTCTSSTVDRRNAPVCRANDDAAVVSSADATDADSEDSKSAVQLQLRRLDDNFSPAIGTTATTAVLAPTANAATTAATTITTTPVTASSSSQHIHLWQFLKELLTASAEDASARRGQSPSSVASTTESSSPSVATNTANKQQQQMIRWLDRKQGVFKIEDSQAVARLWGLRKKRPAMNYDKLSRSLRQYYKKKIMQKTERSQRLVYQFCPPYNA